MRCQCYTDIGLRQQAFRFLGPLRQFQSAAGKDVTKARVFPLLRVVEAIKVKMPHRELREFIRLHYRVGRTFDTARHAQGLQQVAYESGFAGAQLAVQGDECIAQFRLAGQKPGKRKRSVFIRPEQGFYNGGVTINSTQFDGNQLVSQTRAWALKLGFSQIGVAGVDLSSAEPGLLSWLEAGFHGDMAYMHSHGLKRARPVELVPGTLSVITVRMDYLPQSQSGDWTGTELQRLQRTQEGIVSVYARGRDYHKVLRSRLQKLADQISGQIGPLGYRAFTDSAPVLEVELATRSGQGWRGKHSLLLNRDAGSMFFLGELFVDIALPPTEAVQSHCGSCAACIDACPTQAIVAPYQVDARRCISYLTIEHAGTIAPELRPLMGNRIYGCDDCQLVCPWNKFAKRSALPDFDERAGLSGVQLTQLLDWSEAEFLQRTEGSPIRRIGHARWLRNVAVALGNALAAVSGESGAEMETFRGRAVASLKLRLAHPDAVVREHVEWALSQGSA